MLNKLKDHIKARPDLYLMGVGAVMVTTGVVWVILTKKPPRYPMSQGGGEIGRLLVVDVDRLPTQMATDLLKEVGPTIKARGTIKIP